MKLPQLTLDMLRRAVDIYLAVAYPDARMPYLVSARVNFDAQVPLNELINGKAFEHSIDAEGVVDKYQLRLGNHAYPHMKLGLERCAGGDEFVFVVDTHDRHIPLDTTLPGSEELASLIEQNTQMQHEVERRWEAAGLPTQARVLSKGVTAEAHPSGKTILIIDDDEAMAELEQLIVEQGGYKAVVRRSAGEALDLIRSGVHIDLCLLDVMMPRVSGLALSQQIDALDCDPFPVVFVTALSHDRVADVKADAIVSKPFEPAYLVRVIKSFIG